jgi:predicted nucleotidyltransferase
VVTGTDPMEGLRRLRAAARSGEVDAVCGRLGVRLLGVFGSAARRLRDPQSPSPRDLDVAVSFDGPPRELELLAELARLTGCDAVDLAVLDGANPLLRAAAFVGIGLYEKAPGGWASAQMAALAEYRDTEHLRRLDLEALAG